MVLGGFGFGTLLGYGVLKPAQNPLAGRMGIDLNSDVSILFI
jgi:hypothetical protein